MQIKRRAFLSGAIAAAVLTGACGTRGATAAKREGDGQTEEFPYLLLELCGKYPGEEGSDTVTHLTSRRMVSVDLEDEDDWGDLNTFWDGEKMAWGLGNDVDGYWKIERAFELMEPCEDLHEGKYPVAYELTRAELGELMAARVESWV